MKKFFKTLWQRVKTSLPEKTLPMVGKATTPFTDGKEVPLATWQPEVKAALTEQAQVESAATTTAPTVETFAPTGPVLTQIVHSPAAETVLITDTTTEGNPTIEVPVVAVKKPRKRKPKTNAGTLAPAPVAPVNAPKPKRKPQPKKAE